MKNSLKKISTLLLALMMVFSMSTAVFAQSTTNKKIDTKTSTYEVTIGNKTLTLKEGEKAEVPLTSINNSDSNSEIEPNAVFIGDAGTLDIWPYSGRVYYDITMNVSATSFSGMMRVTDLTSGLSGGTTPVTGFNGSVSTSNLSGHRYSASLTGEAYLLGLPVANVVPNWITWVN